MPKGVPPELDRYDRRQFDQRVSRLLDEAAPGAEARLA
jgi:hypothetical protein